MLQQKANMPQVSRRIASTDAPVIAFTRKAMGLRADAMSLAQGIVYWAPPPEALQAAATMCHEPACSSYGPNEGLPALREALKAKVARRNGLANHNICVTHGANQAFVNLTLSLVDESDRVVLFVPVYFDHLMTIQQTGGADRIVWGPCHPDTLHPDIEWLRGVMSGPQPPRMVVICNPCNPTGVLLQRGELQEISDICAAAGVWLVCDNTYEDFVWGPDGASIGCAAGGAGPAAQADGAGHADAAGNATPLPALPAHHCVSGPHVVHVFSFSKAYGLMGWRVGYIAYPDPDNSDAIGRALLKTQDTICICATQLSQHVALAALQYGEQYKRERIASLAPNRALLLDALSPLGSPGQGVAGGEGGIYYWAKLPKGCEDDVKAVEWLVANAGVCLVPGSSCKAPGYVRCSFGNLPPERYPEAAARLKAGLQQLVEQGMGPGGGSA